MTKGQKIIAAREAKGWSRPQFIKLLKKPRQTVERWENGEMEPSADNLKLIADILGLDINYFLIDVSAGPRETAELDLEATPERIAIKMLLAIAEAQESRIAALEAAISQLKSVATLKELSAVCLPPGDGVQMSELIRTAMQTLKKHQGQ